jgi:hypothetical protein
MIAHLDNGNTKVLRPGSATMGLRVVRWEFDFDDFQEFMRNPELLGILQTRMVPSDSYLNAIRDRSQP